MSRIRLSLIVLGVVAGTVVALAGIYWLPVHLAQDSLRGLTPKEQLDATGALRVQAATLIGTPLAFATLVYTARKFLLDRAKQDIDRLNTAVAHLGSPDPVTRSGGAFALQRLMEDTPRERDRGVRLLARQLTARTRAGEFTTDAGDLADAVEVVRSVTARKPGVRDVDLSGVRLPGADLHGARLPGARLAGTDLSGADLRGIVLREADLTSARLAGADLSGADLTGAVLRGTLLPAAVLSGTVLTRADLTGAVLTGADLTTAVLRDTDLTGAIGAVPPPAPST